MSDRVEVTVKFNDLHYVRFEFWFRECSLYLDGLYTLKRETTRHKLKLDFAESYSRLNKREYGIKEEPEIPIEVQLEALRIARERITVRRWER